MEQRSEEGRECKRRTKKNHKEEEKEKKIKRRKKGMEKRTQTSSKPKLYSNSTLDVH